MGHTSMVYGAIEILRGSSHERDRYYKHALNEIERLPRCRDEDQWPFLTREMFAICPQFYKNNVLHFGASFKEIEGEWNEWLQKFEQLLQRLHWDFAYLHLRTEIAGHHDFEYQAETEYVGNFGDGVHQLPHRIECSGGPRCNSQSEEWWNRERHKHVWVWANGGWTETERIIESE